MRNYEEEARKQGWKPLEEFDGPEDQWRDAEEFVKRGEAIASNLKTRLEEQSKEIAQLNQRVDQLLKSNQKINEWSEAQKERDAKEREKLLEDLKKARAKAVADGDGEAFDKLDEQIDSVKEQKEPEKEVLDPAAEGWLSENTWYGQNEDLTAYADGISERIANEGYSGKAYFDELTRRVKARFPDEFGNSRKNQPQTVEEGGETASNRKRTFDDLPADAKREFEEFKRDIPGFTKAQYLSTYEWDE